MSDLDFLDEPQGSTEQPTPKPEPVTVGPSPPPAATPAPPQALEPPAAPEPVTVPPGHVPLEALLADREKRQAAERKAEELERQLAEATKKPAEPIDPMVDPEGWQKNLDAQRERDKQDVRFEVTHMFAVQKHGADVVKAAEEWTEAECKANPAFYQTITRQPDPYAFMVQQHKRHQVTSQIGDDPDEYVKKRAAELGFTLPGGPQPEAPAGTQRGPDGKFVAAAPPATPAPLPKPSLASAPAASGATPKIPTGPGAAFAEVFK